MKLFYRQDLIHQPIKKKNLKQGDTFYVICT